MKLLVHIFLLFVITQAFPEELSGEALPYFIDWFIENVVIVEITAYSDENAYTIFETMNVTNLNTSLFVN